MLAHTANGRWFAMTLEGQGTMMRLWVCAGLVAICMAVGACDATNPELKEDVVFPPKRFYDGGDAVSFAGSIVGNGNDGPVNNQISGWCYRKLMQCDTVIQFELRHNALGDLHWETIPVRKWGDHQIVVDTKGKDSSQVFWYEIKIDRNTQEIDYIRIPNSLPDSGALDVSTNWDRRVKHWRIDEGNAEERRLLQK